MRKANKLQQKQINFYERYYYDPEAEARKKSFMTAVIPAAALLAVVIAVFAFFKISDAVHKHEMNNIQEYLSSSSTTKKYDEAVALQNQSDELAEALNSMNRIISDIGALPSMGADVVGSINGALKGAKVVSYTYNSSQREFVIVASTSSASDVPGIVTRMKALGNFSSADYTGYEDSESKYIATITCRMVK